MAMFATTRCMYTFIALYSVVIVVCIGYYAFSITVADHRLVRDTSVGFKVNSVLQFPSLQDNIMHSAGFKSINFSVEKVTSETSESQGNVISERLGAANAHGSDIDFHPALNNSIFLYSAYYRAQQPPVITIITLVDNVALSNLRLQSITCVYGGSIGSVGLRLPGKLFIFADHHGMRFKAAYIHCPASDLFNYSSLSALSSITVAVSTPADNSVTNTLRVQFPLPREYKFLICFSPMHKYFSDVIQVLGNLELAQELGADHAVVYNTSIHPKVNRVLQYYVKTGFLEVKNWRNPPEPIHYKGQMGANNDCLLHNHNRTDYIVFMDFDEMIIPRVHKSWSEMMDDLLKTSSSDFVTITRDIVRLSSNAVLRISKTRANVTMQHESKSKTPSADGSQNDIEIGAVSFPSTIFLWGRLSNLTSEELNFVKQFRVHFLLKQRKMLEQSNRKTKTILNPRAVDYTGIHRVFSFLGREKTLLANETIGLVQHYRWHSSAPSVEDFTMHRFGSVLVHRMKKVLRALETMP